ncbi:MAG: hypothetical protein IPL81_04950 [Flavobacteriales bacterium]|jgi:hypothetical protein|nr:hypothetical protein [Flavobacteriales bacterium]MBK9059230.1 hypothetical protein [Flavobacteriales bacterium]HQV40370.1 hypothetical protein [Flavobacteriales bacterium]HQW33774.1 hypothetical protein [Flavobacteriales bacterium]HQY04380.1 hypothetical protein [Flavobacteriales bacterium]
MTTTTSTLSGIAIVTALIMAACANDPAPQSVVPPLTTEVEMPAPVNDVAAETQAPLGAQLNPAHGDPGHRCEIPVGAPLDGSGPAPATVTMPPAVSPVASPVTSPGAGSGKLNPAHGEPGHDCAVPVGSPLPG